MRGEYHTDEEGVLCYEMDEPFKIKVDLQVKMYDLILLHSGKKAVLAHKQYAMREWFEVERTESGRSNGYWIHYSWWVPELQEYSEYAPS